MPEYPDIDNDLPKDAADETAKEYGRQLALDSLVGHALSKGPVGVEIPGRTRASWTRFLPVPLTLAAGLALVAGVWWMAKPQAVRSGQQVVAKVEQGSGFRVQGSGGEWLALKAGDGICAGMRVETEKGGKVRVKYLGEETSVEVGEVTGVGFKVSARGGKELVLDRGTLVSLVAKQPFDTPFVITTPRARATALGTRFRLADDGNASWLNVTDGIVRLDRLAEGDWLNVASNQMAVAGKEYALKTYAKDAQYVEGAVIIEDEFDKGLGQWDVIECDETPTMQSRPLVDPQGKYVRLAEDNRDGKACKGVLMERGDLRGRKPAIRLKKPVTAAAYVVEWNYKLWASPQSDCSPLFEDVTGLEFVRDRDKQVGSRQITAAHTWNALRAEVTPRAGSPAKLKWDMKVILSGRLLTHAYVDFDSEKLGFDLTAGRVFVDKVVVRSLERVPFSGGPE
ncbi:MAG: hypothetical protein C0404_03090 [Verrucomicrobia bacterium]|nr:hypothetical protein [Verrucomicrobiota bacterium]